MFGSISKWLGRPSRRPAPAGRPVNRFIPRFDGLEIRVVPACTSTDRFICSPLPPSHDGLAVHIHPHLTITINGQNQVIPANVGITLNASGQPTAFFPLHTHDASGTIHVESPTRRDFHLKDFFDVWGQKFDRTHILDFQTTATNPVKLTVNGKANTQFGNLLLHDGDQIAITATNATPVGDKTKPGPGAFFTVGGNGHVIVYRNAAGEVVTDFQPFGASYTGGISVAQGDVNGDGFKDLVVSTTSGSAQVKVFDGKAVFNGTLDPNNLNASQLASFNAIDSKFGVGVNVAVGDVEHNGFADIVTGATAGNPDVRVFRGKDIKDNRFNPTGSSLVTHFFAYGLQFNVGANVAVGDLNKDGFADVITGATAGNPHVKIYDGRAIAQGRLNQANPDANLVAQFFAYGLQFNVGVNVAVGDVNGDGNPELITGASAGNPHVKAYDGAAFTSGKFNPARPDDSAVASFFAYDSQFNVGATVAAADVEGNGKLDIITGASTGSPHYRVVKGTSFGNKPPAVKNIEGIPPAIQGGITVAG